MNKNINSEKLDDMLDDLITDVMIYDYKKQNGWINDIEKESWEDSIINRKKGIIDYVLGLSYKKLNWDIF